MWRTWYEGLTTALWADYTKGLDSGNDDHASRAVDAILDKLPQEVVETLRSEGVFVPGRHDPKQLLKDMDKFSGL